MKGMKNMSALKIFISSTCLDFKEIRYGLRSFITSLGYEPVLSEYADILYDPHRGTPASCIAEVENSDMLVLLIGGRFGSEATSEAISMIDFEVIKEKMQAEARIDNIKLSITHLEVLKAIEVGIPVYTFIKQDILQIYNGFKDRRNRHLLDELYSPSIENPKTTKYIFEFIDILQLRKAGNSIFSFQKEADIEDTLKKQWASLFKKCLKARSNSTEDTAVRDLERAKETIRGLKDIVNSQQKLIDTFINDTRGKNAVPVPPKKIYKKILWVDDCPEGNKAVMNYYEKDGIHFETALTTRQGVNLFKENLYDLVITDMARWNENDAGVKLIKELKHLNCQVPIIVFSSRLSIQKHIDEITKLGIFKVTNRALDVIAFIADIYGLPNEVSPNSSF